jgi:hypothetical protein
MSEHFQNETEKSEKSVPLTHKGMPDKFRSNTDTSIKRGRGKTCLMGPSLSLNEIMGSC